MEREFKSRGKGLLKVIRFSISFAFDQRRVLNITRRPLQSTKSCFDAREKKEEQELSSFLTRFSTRLRL